MEQLSFNLLLTERERRANYSDCVASGCISNSYHDYRFLFAEFLICIAEEDP